MSKESHVKFHSTFSELTKQYTFTIEISESYISDFFNFAALAQQQKVHSPGFKESETPIEYIKEHYKKHMFKHMQEITLRYFVVDYLLEMIVNYKVP